MEAISDFATAASRLRTAIENNIFGTLQTNEFRVFIHGSRGSNNIPRSVLEEVLKDLLVILSSGHLCNNNQIVVATAYCKTVSFLEKKEEDIFQHILCLLKENENQEWTVFICHGIFHLSCWKTLCKEAVDLLEEIFKIVQTLCCKLTSMCYFAFKVLNSFLTKTHELYSGSDRMPEETFKAVLEIVLSNWENPLNGVRQQNTKVFKNLLLCKEDLWKCVLTKASNKGNEAYTIFPVFNKCQCLIELILCELSWSMKSKYFLLTAIVEEFNVLQILAVHKDDIVAGLIRSLSIPYLVPAGTDLYLALLACLSLDEWLCWFFEPIMKVISQQTLCLEMENIFNYWMQETLKKFPSVLKDFIEKPAINLFALITLHKIGRKEGFPCSEWEVLDKTKIKEALEDYSDKLCSQAFSLVCTSSKTSVLPNNEEFQLIQQFLKHNVNSDNTALRQALLNSFTNVVIRIRDALIYIIRNRNDDSYKCFQDHSKCFSFLDWLHSFLLYNLEESCNYQRKTTSLKLYKIILSYFGEEIISGNNCLRRCNKDHLNLKKATDFSWEYKFESEFYQRALLNCLFDDDNDVRFCSANIITSYFNITNFKMEELEMFFWKGKSLCSDQMFYKAESGALITKVLVNLAYRTPLSEFRNKIHEGNNNFFGVLLRNAEEQFICLHEDLLKAATQKSFLYGTLHAIELLLADTSIPQLSLTADQLERLITFLEKVAEYFISVLASKSDPISGYAPSFGEMGMAIAAVVASSSLKNCEETVDVGDDTFSELQLTPAQQLVLNCVWLNLKECCKLCSSLVSNRLDVKDSQRCVAVVLSVLQRCRHKGAIESAGLALSHITTHLTKSNNLHLKNLPDKILQDFFKMLVGTSATTVSRRSAGLAILVHRLITGDSRPKKPLLHICMSRLLEVVADATVPDQEVLVDLPQSQALHFLRTLVQESSLKEHMAQYTLNLSLVALTNLASPIWTIRNAALQLFGALVPKLVGQKPNQQQGRGNHHLAFEELFIHAKPLVEMMLYEFSSATGSDSTTSHSKIMPLLTLVTNLTLGLHTVLTDSISDVIHQFQQCFKSLFKSSIFSVRRLSAKAHAMFTASSTLVDTIKGRLVEVNSYIEGNDCSIQSENELHGYMLNLQHLFERFEEEKTGMKILFTREQELHNLLESFSQNLLSSNCSYFTKSLVFKLKIAKPCLQNLTIPFGNSCEQSLGFSHFINQHVFNAIEIMSEKEIIQLVDFCLLKNLLYDIQFSCLKALSKYVRLNNLTNDTSETLLLFHKDFLSFRKHSTVVIRFIFDIMLSLLVNVKFQNWKHSDQFCCPDLLSYCLHLTSSAQILTSVMSALPVTSALLSVQNTVDMDSIDNLATLIKTSTESDFNEDIKLYAAIAIIFLVEIVKSGKMKESKCGQLIWKACVNLLQDEDTEVRYEASKFVSVLMSEKYIVQNPFVSLMSLFRLHCIIQFMSPDKAVDCLWEKMVCIVGKDSHSSGISNPFDHGVKSIYAEESVISHLSFCCLVELVNSESGVRERLKQLCGDTFQPDISSKSWAYTREIQKICLGV